MRLLVSPVLALVVGAALLGGCAEDPVSGNQPASETGTPTPFDTTTPSESATPTGDPATELTTEPTETTETTETTASPTAEPTAPAVCEEVPRPVLRSVARASSGGTILPQVGAAIAAPADSGRYLVAMRFLVGKGQELTGVWLTGSITEAGDPVDTASVDAVARETTTFPVVEDAGFVTTAEDPAVAEAVGCLG